MCFFFFFKQKTAYEMRISDWISDVCSSDLFERAGHAAALGHAAPAGRGGMAFQFSNQQRCGIGCGGNDIEVLARREPGSDQTLKREIGREVCRERECIHVYTRAVGLPLKTKHNESKAEIVYKSQNQ